MREGGLSSEQMVALVTNLQGFHALRSIVHRTIDPHRGLISEGTMRMSVSEWVKLAFTGLWISIAMWSWIALIVVLFFKIGAAR
jgi:hypothetical protein